MTFPIDFLIYVLRFKSKQQIRMPETVALSMLLIIGAMEVWALALNLFADPHDETLFSWPD